MLSLKLIIIGGVLLSIFAFIVYTMLDPLPLFQQELGVIPAISQWDIYFITVFIPLSVLFGLFFNSSGMAINPYNKRFASTASVIITLAIISAIWFFFTNDFLIPYTENYLYANIYSSGASDFTYLLFYILSTIGLPILTISIASPAKTSTFLRSLRKFFN